MSFCRNCGTQVGAVNFCPACGQDQSPDAPLLMYRHEAPARPQGGAGTGGGDPGVAASGELRSAWRTFRSQSGTVQLIGWLLAVVALLVASPILGPVAFLAAAVCLIVAAVRAARRRPARSLVGAAVGLLVLSFVLSGVSQGLYGSPPTQERASAPVPISETSEERTSEPTQAPVEETTTEPEPEPEPEPDPEPQPVAREEEEDDTGRFDAVVTVSRVVDGDTIEISPAIDGTEDVRLIGVDTPETVDPGEEVEPFGPEASQFATDRLQGEEVELEFDSERVDQYGRLLAYVYPVGGRMFNEVLVEEGYAQAYPYPPNTRYEGRFASAQESALAYGLGIWGLPLGQQCLLQDRGNGIGEGSTLCAAPEPSVAAPDPEATPQAPAGGSVPPISEDECPPSHPVKGNQSGIYHDTSSSYYDVTNPEECFAAAADAEAAGYRAPLN